MKSTEKTQKQLAVENKNLRDRLGEAEETLRAIRSGEWDALVVSGAGGKQVVTLKQSELRYRRLFEAAQDGILILDAETGAIKDVNPYLIKMLGYSRTAFIGKKLWELGAFKDIEASQEAFEALQKNEYMRYDDLPLKTKGGRLVPVEFVSNVYQVDDEKVIQCNIRNITARKQATDALRESEERYRLLVDALPDGVVVHSQGRVVFANPASATLLGAISPADLTGKPVLEFVHPDSRELVLKRIQQSLSEGLPLPITAEKFVRQDGTPMDVEVSAIPFSYAGKPAMLSVFNDITARLRAEEALHESEVRYRSIFENSQDAILLTAPDGTILDVNPATCQMFGRTADEIKRLGRNALVDTTDPRLRAALQKRARTGKASSEITMIHADGSKFPADVTSTTFTDAQGQVRTSMIIRDITERKEAEDALAESEQHYRQIIETAGEGIWTIDEVNRTTLVNQHLADMLGYTVAEMIGKSLYDFMDEEGKVITAKSLENRRQGINEQLDFKYKRKDGSTVWALTETSTLLDHDHQYIGALAMLTDITQRKQIEAEIGQRLSELELLYKSSLAFNQLRDPKAIAEKIIELLAQEMNWHHTAIRLYNPENQLLELLAFNLPHLHGPQEHSAAEERFKILQRVDQGLSGWVIKHGAALRSNDLKNDTRYVESFPGLQSGLYVPIKIAERVIGAISIESEQAEAFSESDERLAMTLATQAASAMDNALLLSDLKYSNIELALTYDATIEGWSSALDLRDKETEGHSQRVTELTLRLARSMGMGEEELIHVRRGALLHDIGKMGVPDSILLKPGSLTEEEWVIMKKHPTFAYELLAPIRYLRLALDLPYCHHEKWDGSGYPRGLKGVRIPLAARIFAIVDVWDALNSDRPYRPAWAKEKALQHIRALSGTHFDPHVVDVFMQMID